MNFVRPFFLVLGLGVLLTSFTSCGSAARNKLEADRIKAILLLSRTYASDNSDKYPGKLADLHPKYISLSDNFYSPPLNESEPEPLPFYYRPGLTKDSKMDEPVVVSPHLVGGKVSVGYRGGAIRRMSYDDAQKILSLPGWLKSAPPLKKKKSQ